LRSTDPRRPRALMLQGTGSNVGKSLLTAGLCRALTRRGLIVRPFKPQNMSNNAAVTADGGEIGRAQALQARACGVAPITDMNPVLLKPQTDIGAQVVVHGKVFATAKAGDYQRLRPSLLPAVLDSFRRLTSDADIVLVEGAGSPAEVNLRPGDIANMGFAEAADLPVVLVADIDRGGVIASVVGTWMLLAETERRRLRGAIINKFRGDIRLFDGGLRIISERTGLGCFGVVPWFQGASRLPAEDAVAVEDSRLSGSRASGGAMQEAIRVVVPLFSRIANFDDLDPLIAEPDVAVEFVEPGRALPVSDVIVLPGSKSTLGDLAFLRAQGWDIDVLAHVRRGGTVVGLCGGYQMLGISVNDPDAIEGLAGQAAGLGLLAVETVLTATKALVDVEGEEISTGTSVRGYEMHMGATSGPGLGRPMLRLGESTDGAISPDGKVYGCYLHGLFASDAFRQAFLGRIRARQSSGVAYEDQIEQTLDALADHLEANVDVDKLLAATAPVHSESG
jgi:adenosylcobyric acid synthase